MEQVEEVYRIFGRRLAQRRNALKILQADLAAQVGMKRASVANVEAGRQRITLHQALALAAALRSPIQELLPEQETPDAFERSFEKLDRQQIPVDDEVRRWVLRAIKSREELNAESSQ